MHLKMDGWYTTFLLGPGLFSVGELLVSGGHGIVHPCGQLSSPGRALLDRLLDVHRTFFFSWKKNLANMAVTLPETNIAHENHLVSLQIPSKFWIFYGYVSFREGSLLLLMVHVISLCWLVKFWSKFWIVILSVKGKVKGQLFCLFLFCVFAVSRL